ncbi:MAG: FtsQ-type POTRA domain-containing protein [Proteobacteria bacterium]|nr:FtsQ-type POTRA domain-containing protein [Pseudomonadota bacterium]
MVRRASRTNPSIRSRGYQAFLFRVFIVTVVLVSLAGATFLFLSVYLFLRGASFLRLKEVRIEGSRRLSADEILGIIELRDEQNILSLDIKTLNRRLAEHPWIEKSMVKRVFPDGIHIVVQEREPLAVIYLEKFYYVDAKGVIFDEARGHERAAHPILTGITRKDLEKGDRRAILLLEKALKLLKMTQAVKIIPYRSISQIHLDRAVGVMVHTVDKGLEIRMGFDDFETKLQRLSKIWSEIGGMELDYIDSSIPGKVIVKQKRADK